MDSIDLFKDAFTRVAEELPRQLDGLPAASLLRRAHTTGNPIAWLVWHIGRCEDAQMAALDDRTEVWDPGWRERFDLPYGPHDGGYGQSQEEVDRFTVADPGLLLGYYAAVHEQTLDVLEAERGKSLDRIRHLGSPGHRRGAHRLGHQRHHPAPRPDRLSARPALGPLQRPRPPAGGSPERPGPRRAGRPPRRGDAPA